MEHYLACIHGETQPYTNGEDGLATIRMVERVEQLWQESVHKT